MKTFRMAIFFSVLWVPVSASSASKKGSPIQVFILAGQSNMQGQGVVDLDHPKYYNSGKGTFQRVMRDPKQTKRYRHIQDAKGKWVVRNDVWCRYRTRHASSCIRTSARWPRLAFFISRVSS